MKAELGNKFLASTKRDPAFISKGFKNWKNATIAFNAHLRSDCHKEGCEILELRSTTNDVAENLSKMYKEENELNRMMLIKILQNVQFLAHQGYVDGTTQLRLKFLTSDLQNISVAVVLNWRCRMYMYM